MKRILAFVLALVLVLGTVNIAMAAPSDVEGTRYEEAVSRLVGLNVINGYPDGTFQPGKTITRAEFAVVAVKLLGLGNAAEYGHGPTGFSDVPAEHWASGYVNIAVNRGAIKGYPDGSFRPGNDVSYAEAVTILVRVLGYGPAADDEGAWPANYLAKAAELGVTDDVNFYGYAPARRGDIALMADNSLEIPLMERVGYGDEATYEVKDDRTLLSSKIKSDVVKAKLIATYLVDQGLDEDEIAVLLWDEDDKEYDDEKVYDIAKNAGVDFEAYLGEEVTLWLNDDDEVFMLERETEEDDIVVGVIDEINDDEITVIDADGDDDEYDLAPGVKVYINFRDEDYDEDDLEAGMYIKGIIEDGDIETVVATRWSVGIVDEADEDDEEIEWKYCNSDSHYEDNDGDLDLEDMHYDLDLDDLEEDMIVYWYSVLVDEKDEEYRFFFEVYDDGTKIGEFEEYKEDDYVVVDGREYDLAYHMAGDYVDDDIADLLGDDVEIFIGKDGRVVMIQLDEEREKDRDYALVTDVSLYEDKYREKTPYIKLLTSSGDIIEYEISDEAVIRVDLDGDGRYNDVNEMVDRDVDDYVYAGVENQLTFGSSGKDRITIVENVKEFDEGKSNPGKNTLVRYELDRSGCIDELEVVGEALYADDDNTRVDKDNDRIGSWLFVESDTLVFDAYNEEVIEFRMLEDGIEYDIKYVDDDADLEVLVVYGDNFVEDTEYAIYLSKSYIADDEYRVRAIIDGEEMYINTDMGNDAGVFDDAEKGEVFSIDLVDGMITEAEPVSALTPHRDYMTDRVDDINTSRNRIKLHHYGYFLFADDVRVYEYELDEDDGTVDSVEFAKVRDIDEDQRVNVILDEDGYIEYVYIIDDDVYEEPDVIDDILFELP